MIAAGRKTGTIVFVYLLTIVETAHAQFGGAFFNNIASTISNFADEVVEASTVTLGDVAGAIEDITDVVETVADEVIVDSIEEVFKLALGQFDPLPIDLPLAETHLGDYVLDLCTEDVSNNTPVSVYYSGKYARVDGLSLINFDSFQADSLEFTGTQIRSELSVTGRYDSLRGLARGRVYAPPCLDKVPFTAVISLDNVGLTTSVAMEASINGDEFVLSELSYSTFSIEYDGIRLDSLSYGDSSRFPLEIVEDLSESLKVSTKGYIDLSMSILDLSETLSSLVSGSLPLVVELDFPFRK